MTDFKNEHCLHPICKTCRWILTKLAWLHHWERGKKWLGFGVLDSVFKVTFALRMPYLDCTLFPESIDGIRPNSLDCIIEWLKFLIIFLWPWPYFKVTTSLRLSKQALSALFITVWTWLPGHLTMPLHSYVSRYLCKNLPLLYFFLLTDYLQQKDEATAVFSMLSAEWLKKKEY